VRTRIITGLALLPLVALVYFGPAWAFVLLVAAATVGMCLETLRLFPQDTGAPAQPWPTAAAVLLLFGAFFAPDHLSVEAALAAGAALILGGSMLLRPGIEGAHAAAAASLACLVYPGLLMGFQVALRRIGEGSGEARGPALLVFLYAAVFGGDAAAYFVGRAMGRIALAPTISPKKTVEGFVGGLVGGVALALLSALVLSLGFPLGKAALLAALLVVAGTFGDLSKSLLKRAAHVKDSGNLLPGHGGLLDRLDGLLFASPVLYLAVTSPILGLIPERAAGG
jgi:phosphatidate cytidylyltransferase